jgi:hypothetical protein
VSDDWLREIDNKNIVGAVLIDFSAAFNIIDHNLLLEKRVFLALHPLLYCELSNRPQSVFFNGSLSNIIQVESGIPLGSCLGLLLFSIFTNDLPLALSKACVSLYPNDSTLDTSATTASETPATLRYAVSFRMGGKK